MALAGTLKDFSLADIFQLIGLQKKTGVLTLSNDREEARILFMEGMVVGADTNSQKLENHLGHVLVKSNLITQEELEEVLVVQSHTLQRLGQVLIQKGFIKPEDLRNSLQTQTTQIIYRLFRWDDGEYHFQQERYVDYDQENFSPISSESILMEGVRMIDEWPMIEAVIPNFDILLEKTEKCATLNLSQDQYDEPEPAPSESFDDLLEGVLSGEEAPAPPKKKKKSEISYRQENILNMVDGKSIVQEIIDGSGMNEFETCRTLYDLMEMGYIRRAVTNEGDSDVHVIEEEHHIPVWIPASMLLLMVLFGFYIQWNPLNSYLPLPHQLLQSATNYETSSRQKLDRLASAIEFYFVHKGKLPNDLRQLLETAMVDEDWLIDPLGRTLSYEPFFSENRFIISSKAFNGTLTDALKIEKQLDNL